MARVLPVSAAYALAFVGGACSRGDESREPTANLRAPTAPSVVVPEEEPEAIVAARVDLPAARAQLRPTDGHMTSGVVAFDAAANGELNIMAEIAELSPGQHGIHIHAIGDCSAPDAASAGAHFAPDGSRHGGPQDATRHTGDLGNIEPDERGIVVGELPASSLTLTGRHGVVGRSVVVHAEPDDLTSQPDGNSGPRVACGVVRMVESPESGLVPQDERPD